MKYHDNHLKFELIINFYKTYSYGEKFDSMGNLSRLNAINITYSLKA